MWMFMCWSKLFFVLIFLPQISQVYFGSLWIWRWLDLVYAITTLLQIGHVQSDLFSSLGLRFTSAWVLVIWLFNLVGLSNTFPHISQGIGSNKCDDFVCWSRWHFNGNFLSQCKQENGRSLCARNLCWPNASVKGFNTRKFADGCQFFYWKPNFSTVYLTTDVARILTFIVYLFVSN